MMHAEVHRWRKALIDYLVAVILLGLANAYFAGEDFGWLSLNPSPWLVTVVFIGARYGPMNGLMAGLGTSLLILTTRYGVSGNAVADFAEHRFFFLCLSIAGALIGEVKHRALAQFAALSQEHSDLLKVGERLKAELALAKEAGFQLQRQLALLDAPIVAIDEILQRLVLAPAQDFEKTLLECLYQCASVTSAGIYVVQDDRLVLQSAIHPTAPLRNDLVLNEAPLAQAALNERKCAFVDDPCLLTAEQPFLAAIPFAFNQDKEGVLLIQDMPFEGFSPRNLAIAEMILEWSATLKGYHGSAWTEAWLDAASFEPWVARAAKAQEDYGLASSVLRLRSLSDKVEDLRRALPATAVLSKAADGGGMVLLPFCAGPLAEKVERRLGEKVPAVVPLECLSPQVVVEQLKIKTSKP